jgi:Ca2+-binding RTX toxin-like protein
MSIRLWGTEKLVNTTTLNGQTGSVVTALQNGGYVIAWEDELDFVTDGVVKFQRFDALGNKVGLETTVPVPDGEGTQFDVSIATLSNGNFVIANTDSDPALGYDGVFSIYDPNGVLVLQSQSGLDASEKEFGLEVKATATGFAVSSIVTQADPDTDPFVNFYNVNGSFLATKFINTSLNVQDQVSVTYNGNSGTDIVTAVYVDRTTDSIEFRGGTQANGFPSAPVFLSGGNGVSDPHIEQIGVYVGSPLKYALSYTENTGLSNERVSFEILNSSGASLRSYNFAGSESDIRILADQSILLVWTSPYSPTTTRDIHMQQFDRDGTKIGGEMIVNTNGTEITGRPSIAQLVDGRFVATWTDSSSSSDFSGSAVKQQIFDPREGIVTGSDNAAIAETLVGHDALGDTMRGLRGNDTMYGYAGGDVMYGGDGVDTLYGGRGDDTLYGDNGSDFLQGGLGADDISGGVGSDTVYYSQSRVGVNVNLLTGLAFGGDAEGDTIDTVENFIGSNFSDVFVGGNTQSRIDGYAGDDTLTGGSSLDSFFGGAGADTMNGLGGVDRAFYSGNIAVTINLVSNINTGGEAQGDVLLNIEEISGSSQGDTILGNSLNNRFFGQNGNDRLGGGTGIDTLVGGAGSDSFVFALGDSGQTAVTADIVSDYAKGPVGTGDKFDFTTALSIGGVSAAATATQADISQTNAIASFFAGSGTTLADALSDITTSMTTGGNSAGEFAFFKVNGTGDFNLFISDGVAGVTANDVLVTMTGVTAITSIDVTAGDITILA